VTRQNLTMEQQFGEKGRRDDQFDNAAVTFVV